MKLISQFQNYWNKLRLKKYKIDDKIEFIFPIHKIPNRMSGTIVDINNEVRLPICVKLHHPFEEGMFTTSYVNIKLNEILCKIK